MLCRPDGTSADCTFAALDVRSQGASTSLSDEGLSVQATSVIAYDPVWQDEDYRVLGALGITTTDDNLVGSLHKSGPVLIAAWTV